MTVVVVINVCRLHIFNLIIEFYMLISLIVEFKRCELPIILPLHDNYYYNKDL